MNKGKRVLKKVFDQSLGTERNLMIYHTPEVVSNKLSPLKEEDGEGLVRGVLFVGFFFAHHVDSDVDGV